MMFKAFILGGLTVANSISAVPHYPGTTVVPMKWVGSIVPGGPNLTFTGTIQEVVQQIRESNPNYDPSLLATDQALESKSKSGITCGVGGSGNAPLKYINNGITYLQRHGGTCGVEGGKGSCSRVSCSYNSAISLCNEGALEVSRPCADIAGYAIDIRTKCTNGAYRVQGTEEDSNGFNIFVGQDPC